MTTYSDIGVDVATGGVVGVPSTRIPFGASDTTLTTDAALTWDNTARTLDLAASKSGGTVNLQARNTSNTASSKARALIEVAGGTAAEAYLQWSVSGVQNFVFGIDNATANDPLVMSKGTAIGTTNMLAWDARSGGNGLDLFPEAGTNAMRLNFLSSAQNEIPANTVQWQSRGGTSNLAFVPQGDTGTAGRQVVFAYFDSSAANFKSALEYANAAGLTTIDLIKSGGHSRTGGRWQTKRGADVASANTMTLGNDGNFFHITGTTTINGITTANWQSGSVLILRFAASLTVTHNSGAPGGGAVALLLAGAANFSATANDTLTLAYDGTNWVECARAVI